MAIDFLIPTEGRQKQETSSAELVGVDGNAYSIMAKTRAILKEAGASKEYCDEYYTRAMSGDYNHLLSVSMAYLDAEPVGLDE